MTTRSSSPSAPPTTRARPGRATTSWPVSPVRARPPPTGSRSPTWSPPAARSSASGRPGSAIDAAYPGSRVGSAYFKGSGTSFSTAVTSGAAALLLEREPGLTPDQVKARLLGSAAAGPAGNPNIDGHGSLDAYAAAHAGTYDSANAGVTRSLGTGSISLDRGSLQVQIQLGLIPDLLGWLLQPVYQVLFGTNLTAQNLVFDSLEFLTSEWSGSRLVRQPVERRPAGTAPVGTAARWYGSPLVQQQAGTAPAGTALPGSSNECRKN